MATTYYVSTALPQFIQYPLESAATGSNVITAQVYADNGSYPDISAASIDVIRPDGELAVDDQACTESEGLLSYTWTMTAANESLSSGYQIRWRYTVGGVQYESIQRAHICRHVLYRTVSEQDIYDIHPELSDLLPHGWESWDQISRGAWEAVQRRLINKGRRPWLIIEPSALHEPHQSLTLSRIFRSCSTFAGGGSRYAELAKEYADLFEVQWGAMQFVYDSDDDGLEDGGEQSTSGSPVIFLSKTPNRFWSVD